ncbi:MAG: AAA family ATPase [Candidatus Doudnabacteria bacterium RIFCSPHIGHO2_12_FULL_48_11]|uniref:AAA family ATPase n=1 Tax=Candidatus Doudnabacteria bacterium RIFCSPHIGHO2_01_FULL_46_24 TaxID=1817825 RepID=A0A1F5NU77_9BACT|nr:MAG: AAA family ATPase [Candidatus Doudnabacteria bacterium RIFCSPHIGHO2_01_FULL_46_24]OGE95671.1 MAG: AAA family ATPase [Candidatus Doudnabacteria bacterium RIFCSPHIGHO2_12_FULL_48_11]
MEPLASKIRPKSLEEFVGQEHLVGKDKPLRIAIKGRYLFSFILWGPPGVGKTTLARIYANALGAEYFELSAVSAGKDDIRKIVESKGWRGTLQDERSAGRVPLLDQPKVLFLDEIHRFNKAQQDYLLPSVESGKLTLIGATTENPSFEVISPLLSRCRVFVLNELNGEEMNRIIDRTGFQLSKDAKEWLIRMANGDARQAITMLENTVKFYKDITVENLKNTLQSKHLRYDKQADEHYNTISAFIKSMRASQPDAVLYYLARMVEAGEDPKFIARRMVVFASEDVGLADPKALMVANDVFRACETIGYPECAINLAHGAAYLALAPKSRDSYNAYFAAVEDVREHGNLPIPLNIRNAPTKLMKDLDYGKDYEMYDQESYLPEKLKGKKYLKRSKE